ncbi:MAG: DUF2911 domain-containing protein [Gemmatimonadetes bacterium]|nr:DUF2911 domain-containing protein [Gemmatimonadota bacterium]NNM32647.1 DUF2911 domain-containing protein [Gemmatimonadota bacterium]
MTPRESRRPWLKRALWLALALVVLGYGLRGPYFFPVGLALGPCLKDWTSPSSYLPRLSPLRTVDGPSWEPDRPVRICYGAPSTRGRVVFGDGGVVPYGEYWRTGANEPTRVFTSVALRFGPVELAPGRYSLYTVPGLDEWEVILNRSTFHWGYDFSPSVLGQEVGRTTVPAGNAGAPTDTLRFQWNGEDRTLDMTWGSVTVPIPVEVVGGGA